MNYFLMAKEYDEGLEQQLAQKAKSILFESTDIVNIYSAKYCLQMLDGFNAEELLTFFQQTPTSYETGFRQGVIGQILFLILPYEVFKPYLLEKFDLIKPECSIGIVEVVSKLSPIIWKAGDYDLLVGFLAKNRLKLVEGEYLINRTCFGFNKFPDFTDFQGIPGFKGTSNRDFWALRVFTRDFPGLYGLYMIYKISGFTGVYGFYGI